MNKAVGTFQQPIGKAAQAASSLLNNATPSYPIEFMSRDAVVGEWVVAAASPLNHLPNNGLETTATLEPCEGSLLFTLRRGDTVRAVNAVRTHDKYAQFAAVGDDTFPVPVPFNVYGQFRSDLELITSPDENPAYILVGGYAGGNGWNGLPTLASLRGYGIILARRGFHDNVVAVKALADALHRLGAPVFIFHPELHPFAQLGLPNVPVVLPSSSGSCGSGSSHHHGHGHGHSLYDNIAHCCDDSSSDSSSDCECRDGLYDNIE